MTITLFPHQDRGADFLQKPGVRGLFFGMGTGKTITALEAVKRIGLSQLIIVAPPIALTMWAEEAKRHLDLHDNFVQVVRSSKTIIQEATEVLIMSYQIMTTRQEFLKVWAQQWETVLICDESHALKNVGAKRTKAVLGPRGLAQVCDYTWLLTGTPSTRWNDDFYAFLLNADKVGMKRRIGGLTPERFKLRYCIEQEKKFSKNPYAKPVRMVVGNRNTKELAHWIYDEGHALRVDLDEVFESMPPLTVNRYEIALDRSVETKAALETLKGMTLAEIQQGVKNNEPALATVRRQIGVARVKAAVQEILERLESGTNILVGFWHIEVGDALHGALLEAGVADVALINGATSPSNRDAFSKTWNEGKMRVLIGQIGAMGVSLNLQQGGSQIIVVEEDWSPSIMDQFYARLWRYGQKRHVHVDILTDSTKLSKAVARISDTKARQHEIINAIGREASDV